jgi:uncharacterized protein YaaN involved in tellurite resistance
MGAAQEQAQDPSQLDINVDEVAAQAQVLNEMTAEKQKEIAEDSDREVHNLSSLNFDGLDLKKIHDQYSEFGQESLEPFLPKVDQDNHLNAKLGQLERGEQADKDVAKTLEQLSSTLNDLNTRSAVIHRPNNKILRKFYDPLKSFMTRATKASAVIDEIFDALKRSETQMTLDIVKYYDEQKNATKAVRIAKEKAALATAIADKLTIRIAEMEKEGADPELILALKSEVLATIQRRAMDLLSIASSNMQYILSAQILIKGHNKMLDEIRRARLTSLFQFQSAVRIAQGISTQETARRVNTALNSASDNLAEANAQNLENSMNGIYDDSNSTVNDLEKSKKALDQQMKLIETMRQRDAQQVEQLAINIKKHQAMVDYTEKRNEEARNLNSSTEEIMKDIELNK